MKNYKVVLLIAKGLDKETQIEMFYGAAHIRDVIAQLKIDLIDEATEVLSISYQAPLNHILKAVEPII